MAGSKERPSTRPALRGHLFKSSLLLFVPSLSARVYVTSDIN